MLAKNILAATSGLFPKGKLITNKNKGIWVIENANMPAVIFESGFISNPTDLKRVKTNVDKIANNILDGIEAYFLKSNQNISIINDDASKDEVSLKQSENKPIKKINETNKDTYSIKIESKFNNNQNVHVKSQSESRIHNIDSTFTFPVENGEIKSKLGYSLIPGSKNLFTNNVMLTIKVEPNSVIKSINRGEVVFVGDVMGVKNVMIKHGDIYSSYNGITPNVKKGQLVSRGQVIGKTNNMPNGETTFEFGIADKDGNFFTSINMNGMKN